MRAQLKVSSYLSCVLGDFVCVYI